MPTRALRVLIVLGTAAVGSAQTKEVMQKRVEQLNARAMEDFDALEFESAKRQALEGVETARKADLANDPVVARLHVTLGVIYVAGLKDPYRGFQEFRKALRIDPTVQVDPSVATPELQEVFQNARASLKDELAPPPPPPTKDNETSTATVTGLAHRPIDEARAGFPIVVRADVGDDVGARRVRMYYRTQGREDFVSVQMVRSGRFGWAGQIPANAARGRAIHYYIEALDVRGRPVAQNASAASPNIISLIGGRNIERRPTPSAEATDGAKPRTYSLGLGLGTGFGLVGFGATSENLGENGCRLATDSDCQAVEITTGFASAPFHIAPELAVRVAELWHVGLFSRIQVISGAKFKEFDKRTFTVLGRVKRYFSEDSLRFYLSGGIGGGQMTHGVNLGADGDNEKDTVTSGKFALGLGFGVNYDFTPSVGAIAELHTLTLLPDNPTWNIDLNVGMQFMF